MTLFEWDEAKAESNLKKHGVSFREAMTVFDDAMAQTFPDDVHSKDESRSVTICLSSRQRLLFLSHLERDSHIRLVLSLTAQARPVDQAEREAYEELKRRS